MAGMQDALKAVRSVPTKPAHLTNDTVEQSENVPDEGTVIADVQPSRAFAVQEGTYTLDVMAYESYTTNGTADDSETFNLSHGVVNSENVAQSVVVYVVGTGYLSQSEVTVDYDADTVTFADSGTNNDAHVFYVASAQADVEIRKVSPSGDTKEALDNADLSLLNRQDQNKRPLRFDFDHDLQGVVPANWTLEVVVDAPYSVVWGVDTNSDGEPDAQPTNQFIDAPIRRARQPLPDYVSDVVGTVAGGR